MSTSTTVSFISTSKKSQDAWDALAEVIGTISLWELWFFGAVKKSKGDPISYEEYSEETGEYQDVVLDPDSMCLPEWVDADEQELYGPLEGRWYSVIRAVNAVLMFRYTKGELLSPEFMAALKEGGYWDSSTPRQIRMMLDYWHGIYGDVVESAPAETMANNCHWFSEKKPFDGFTGEWWVESRILDMLWLPQGAPFREFLDVMKTDTKEDGSILLYDTLWVLYTPEWVYFPQASREGRFRYTWKGEGPHGGDHRWVAGGDAHMLGNTLFWWCLSEPQERHISKLLNKDATNLVAPNRVYGHPSPLNRSSDRDTVGHLTLKLDGGAGYSIYVETDNDNDAYAAAAAAKYAFQEALPVLFQHQLESIRVGKAAAGLGKSTIKLVLPVQGPDGSMKKAKVRLSLGQIAVDKIKKLFNRDSLEFRCQPVLDAQRDTSPEQMAVEDSLVSQFDKLADDLLK